MSETAVTFAGVGRASIETAVTFAGEKWVFLVQFSGAEVMPVSAVPCWGRAVVVLVSMSPRCRAWCAIFFALLGLMVGVSATKFAQRAQIGPNSAFLRLLGEFFRGDVAGGAVLGELFRANWPCVGLGCDAVHFRVAAVGGFAPCEALWRRVAGVSEAWMASFPRVAAMPRCWMRTDQFCT
ncbi:hypothetical protein HMPREF0970_02157 [Schaalia odontolytica F0309]|uniref:Uncharacterized protein n=3 Tax=Schaalia odontolytica TaxID=1660 RepID=A0A857A7P3_9ACTO|nr:hypothetical protein [Schaalia odontolytica]EFF78890.1 hypothetical protein HMPREF0970_02157 [Schaalia odontolytica F0309]QGS10037.1 hypothetical protein FOC40_00470 [Schaalia odontolytica]